MSVRLAMLQVARLAPRLLGESAALVEGFVRSRLNRDGGFADRSGASDLYYTVFGLQALAAVHAELPGRETGAFLRGFGAGEDLDFVHLSCLVHCRALLRDPDLRASADRIAASLETFRTPDGGYHAAPGAAHGTAYHAFLALSAYQDLGVMPPHAARLCESVASLEATDGGFANMPGQAQGSTPATAAALIVLRQFDAGPRPRTVAWLLAQQRAGGFVAAPSAPIPDLLSTATALHALDAAQAPLAPLREPCLDFIDTLWTSSGAFYGSWLDDTADCEYTYYGLLALGHLAV